MLWFILLLLSRSATGADPGNVKFGCEEKCGDVIVPYPFGIDDSNCAMNDHFFLNCSRSDSPHKLMYGDIGVLSISIEDGSMIATLLTSKSCFDRFGNLADYVDNWVNLGGGPFRVSKTRNKLTAFGCDTLAFMTDVHGFVRSACVSICTAETESVNGTENSCSGIGCCQTPLPQSLKTLNLTLRSPSNHSDLGEFMPCDYALLADVTFNLSDFRHSEDKSRSNATIEWVVKEEECPDQNSICGKNSNCTYSVNGEGYRCLCNPGFKGNPYLGCHDIDECKEAERYPCEGTCKNIIGDYKCDCPIGMHGDGKLRCRGFRITTIAAVCTTGGLGMLFLLTGAWWLYKFVKRRGAIKLKQKFFKRNGGLLLQQELSSNKGIIENTKVFTSEELKKATDNFNMNRILGQGGQGTVYKGMLVDGKIVAVKKSKIMDGSKVEEFINEVVILSQINHRNVVKLLGCCLETEVPLLVYEFVPNGTLFQYVHDQNEEFSITWEMRLRIAVDVSGAVSYLHSAASIPIYHRDIKSTNILLDDKYCPKVADFGASRSMAVDQTHMTTQVRGTFGYLDPEYFRSSQFTEKSDVYSFGVVLAELLTGEKPIRLTNSEEDKSLAAYFLCAMKEERLFEIIDAHVLKEGDRDEITKVAKLAKRCLNLNGKKRPAMREVSMELAGIRGHIGASNVVHESLEETACEDGDITESSETGVSFTQSFFDGVTIPVDADSLISNKW